MARNGSGTMTIPNSMTSQQPVTASAHNQNYSDIANELTNSVAADGQTTMTGPLKASNGSVTNPSHTFGSDQNTGRYRKSADVMADVCNGAEVVEYSATGIEVTGDVEASGVLKQAGFAIQPIGLGPLQWTGRTAPPGWVLTGQTYNRDDYPDLWDFAETEIAAGNTFYTNGNGTTTFTVGTMEGYVPAGTDSGGARIASFTDVGDTAGASARTLETANLPPYTPSGTNSTSSVSTAFNLQNNSAGTVLGGGGSTAVNVANNVTGSFATAAAQSWTGVAQGGTSTSFGIVQPSRAFSFIVFAGA
jgi:microcystin-dependent protein